jgi:hypothetical protein
MKPTTSLLVALLLTLGLSLTSFKTAPSTLYVFASAETAKYAYFSNIITAESKYCSELGPYSRGYYGQKYVCDHYGNELVKQANIDYDEEPESPGTGAFESYSTASSARRTAMSKARDRGLIIRTVML